MAYVSDKGKRTAPKRQPPPKPRVQKPPHGDVISSGGDYGTREAKRYSSSKAFAGAVQKTFREQSPARQKEIAGAVQGKPTLTRQPGRIGGGPSRRVPTYNRPSPGPAAAAIRKALVSQSGGDDLHTKQYNDVDAIVQNDIIQRLHRESDISSTGDTKSNLEFAAADAFKGTSGYGNLINQLDQARQIREAPSSGQILASGITGKDVTKVSGLSKLIDKHIGPIAHETAKNLGIAGILGNLGDTVSKNVSNVAHPGTGYPAGWSNIPSNALKEAIDFPGQVIPSTYQGVVVPALKGDIKTLAKNQVQAYVDLYKHPGRTIQEHPLSTAAALLPIKGVSNALRTAAVRSPRIPVYGYRPPAVFPNSGLYQVRPTARGIVGAAIQSHKDRFFWRGEAEHPLIDTTKPSKRGVFNPIEVAAHRDFGSMEQIRRMEREHTAQLHHDIFEGGKPNAGQNLLAQNRVRTIGDMREYRAQVQNDLVQNQNELAKAQKANDKRNVIKGKNLIKAQKEALGHLDKFFKKQNPDDPKTKIDDLPDHAEFPHKWRVQTERYKAASVHLQEQMGKLYGQTNRLEMRRLLVYAGKRMGAEHINHGFIDNTTGEFVDKSVAKDIKKSYKIHENGITAKQRDDRQHEYNQRISEVEHVWRNAENNKILTADAVREHMSKQPGPFEKEHLDQLVKDAQAVVDQHSQRLTEIQTKLNDRKTGTVERRQLITERGKLHLTHRQAQLDLVNAKQGIKTERVPPTAEGKAALEQAQMHMDLTGEVLSDVQKKIAEHEQHISEGQQLFRQGQERKTKLNDLYHVLGSSAEIESRYGFIPDSHIHDLTSLLKHHIENSDSVHINEAEAKLAASIHEKQDLARQSGSNVFPGDISEEEQAALDHAVASHDELQIVRTQLSSLRARESLARDSATKKLYRDQIEPLQNRVGPLRELRDNALAEWRKQRVETGLELQVSDEILKAAEDRIKQFHGSLTNLKIDEAAAGRDFAEASRIESAAAEKGTVQEKLTSLKNQGLTEPAYISHAPRRSSVASYFVDPTRPQMITPGGYRGTAIERGLADLGPESMKQDLVRAAGLVTAAEQFTQMIRENGIRKDALSAIHDATGAEIVPAEKGPGLATYGNKRAADSAAENFNIQHKGHEVTPVRMALTSGQQREFLAKANDDVTIARIAQDAMKDALEGTDIKDGGTWALLPADYAKEAQQYLHKTNPIIRMISSQFRRTVLGLSIPWFVGNITEASMRTALARVGAGSYMDGKMVMEHLRTNDPALYAQVQTRAAGGGHYGIQRSVGIYTGREHLAHATPPERRMADLIASIDSNKVTGPPTRIAGEAWDIWTDWVFNKTNGALESKFQRAMLGRAMRDMTAPERRAMRKQLPLVKQLMPKELRAITNKAMKDLIDNKLDIRTVDELGRQVDVMYGKYSKFSPQLKRMIATGTPFIAWYLNSVRFLFHTMPKDHPLLTGILANADAATREWKKDHGLGVFIDKNVPPFLQGSIPTEGGSSRLGRYTPFSVMGDPLGAAAGVVFPQFKSIILNAMGLDWKGDKLPDGNNPFVRSYEVIKSIMGAMLPGYNIAAKAVDKREGESASQHARRTLGDPFIKSKTPAQQKGSSGGGGYKIPGGSGGSSSSSGGGYKIP